MNPYESGMPNKLIEFARCVEAAHGIGVKGRRSSEWRCMKESKKWPENLSENTTTSTPTC